MGGLTSVPKKMGDRGSSNSETDAQAGERQCASCHAVLDEGAVYCASCGSAVGTPVPAFVESEPVADAVPASLETPPFVEPEPGTPSLRQCASCHAVLDEGAVYCASCGSAVGTPVPAFVEPEPVADAVPASLETPAFVEPELVADAVPASLETPAFVEMPAVPPPAYTGTSNSGAQFQQNLSSDWHGSDGAVGYTRSPKSAKETREHRSRRRRSRSLIVGSAAIAVVVIAALLTFSLAQHRAGKNLLLSGGSATHTTQTVGKSSAGSPSSTTITVTRHRSATHKKRSKSRSVHPSTTVAASPTTSTPVQPKSPVTTTTSASSRPVSRSVSIDRPNSPGTYRRAPVEVLSERKRIYPFLNKLISYLVNRLPWSRYSKVLQGLSTAMAAIQLNSIPGLRTPSGIRMVSAYYEALNPLAGCVSSSRRCPSDTWSTEVERLVPQLIQTYDSYR